TWDSDTLYEFIYERGYESLFDAKLLTFHSHVSIVYAYLLVLFKLFFHNIRTGYFVLNALCIIAASFGMLFLLRNIVPGKKNRSYIIAGIMFMLSPWVCGMSTYHMYDYYIWCLFPLLILYALQKNWIGFFAAGVLITFSKTTGLVVFGSACIGVLAVDAWSYIKAYEGFLGTLKKLLSDIKYWCFLCVLIVFTLFFKLGISPETQFEDTVIGFDAAHTFHQMKLFTFANFIWIFVACSIILLIRLFITKKTVLGEEQKKALMILLISDAVFFVSNCLIITYRMPRYMDSHIAAVYVFAAVFFLSMDNVKVSNILMSVITAVTFIAGFRMIDPLSLAIFSPMDVGTHRIVDFEMTDHPSLEDSIVCNREYYSYEIVLGKALTYVMDSRSPDDGIMFSLGDQALTWGFAGGRYSYNYKDGKKFFEEFYDKKIGGMANGYSYDYYETDDMIPYDMQYIFPNETVKEAAYESNAGTFWYIYMPTLNCSKEQEIYNDFNVVSEEQFTFRGWQMNCIRFSSK
nr:hypothetical protein [Lachnospiraceae bacterium]